MSVLTLNVDEVMRTLSAESSNPFVVHDKEVDIVRFAINSGFTDIVLDGQVALRVMYQRPGETEVRAQTLTYYDTDGLHNYYDWQLSQSDLAKNGSLMVALCILDISGGEVSEWHTTPCAVRVLSTIHTDDSDEGDDTITPTVKERVAVLESMIQRVASGAPIVVASTSAMTDTDQIYVLKTDGKWYYHNGSAWVAGGEYGGVLAGSITTDKLADGAVTTAKIADGAITAGKIADDVKGDLSEYDFVVNKGTTLININDWEQGSISSGKDTPNNNRVRCGYKGLENFPSNFTVFCEGYMFSVHFYSSESVDSWIISSGSWQGTGSIVNIPTGAKFVRFAIKKEVDGALHPNNVVHNAVCISGESKIHNTILKVGELNEFSDDAERQLNILGQINPFLSHYKDFVQCALDTSSTNVIKIGAKLSDRYSVVVNMSENLYLTMTNPLYVFRLYYWENDVLHHTDWGDTWEIPLEIDVGITIKRRDSASFLDDEKPYYYLISTDVYNEPKAYFRDEIDDTIAKVYAENDKPSLCFLLSSDQHTMSVQGTLQKYDTITDMVVNMKRLAKEFNFDGNICLGDIADYKVPNTTVIAERYGITDLSADNLDDIFYHWMNYAINQLQNIVPNFIYVMGNHDDNRYINRDVLKESVSTYDYTKGEIYSYYISKVQNNRVSNDANNGLDYYIDYPNHKVRIIILNSNYYDDTTKAWWYGYADETLSWFTQILANVPDGYQVMVLSHMSPVRTHNEDTSNYKNYDNIANAIQSFIDGGGDYIATLYGHTHADWSVTEPWLEICFSAQKCQNMNAPANLPNSERPTRTAGTHTEDSWSIVIIQPKSRKIKIIRFGAGSDKEFSY